MRRCHIKPAHKPVTWPVQHCNGSQILTRCPCHRSVHMASRAYDKLQVQLLMQVTNLVTV